VDQSALVDRLSGGRLRAALDVVEPEPLDAADSLWASGALITPHIAGNSPAFLPRAIALVEDQLRRWAEGRPLRNVVGKEHR
jgi:phosphoglycerate dehydrogenase-like enzyme